MARWSHGRDDWVWNERFDCWISYNSYHEYFCLGDRMFHQAFGKNRGDLRWHGSYEDNWHGGIQTDNLQEALEWLWEANGKGHELW